MWAGSWILCTLSWQRPSPSLARLQNRIPGSNERNLEVELSVLGSGSELLGTGPAHEQVSQSKPKVNTLTLPFPEKTGLPNVSFHFSSCLVSGSAQDQMF